MRKVGRFLQILSEERGCQSVGAPVGSLRHLLQTLKLLDWLNGAKNLLATDGHVIVDLREHSGLIDQQCRQNPNYWPAHIVFCPFFSHLDVVSLVRGLLASSDQLGTLVLANVDVLQDLIELFAIHLLVIDGKFAINSQIHIYKRRKKEETWGPIWLFPSNGFPTVLCLARSARRSTTSS